MAITCEWERPLGKATTKYGESVTFYGGGNVLCVMCYDNKNLENFIVDIQHFKNCEYQGNEYTDIEVFTERKRESKQLINCLLQAGFSFKVRGAK